MDIRDTGCACRDLVAITVVRRRDATHVERQANGQEGTTKANAELE